jgi:TolA-binding protein
MVSGRKVHPLRTEGPVREVSNVQEGGAGSMGERGAKGAGAQYANSQHIYKLEDDLRRTRDIVEDLKHTTSLLEGDMRDIKAEMERISYLLRSLEGLRNAMKDIESTVSELSGLYDMISANVNPFIDIPKMDAKGANGTKHEDARPARPTPNSKEFVELSEIFDEEVEGEEQDIAKGPRQNGNGNLDSGEPLLRWTQFLLEKVGREGLEKALDYYKDLGWIDEEMIERVLEMARGTTAPVQAHDGKRSSWRMDPEDHMRSLEHIKRITGRR